MVDPIVRHTMLLGHRRAAVVQRCQELEHQLSDVDEALSALIRQRKAIAEELRAQRDRLLTTLQRLGRRPAPEGFAALPPVPADAQFVRGRRLRGICLALLARFGDQSLVELHGLLHRHGFAVDHRHSVKALADALGYETDRGRVRRVRRGVYAANGAPPRRVMALLVSPC
jgi:hypothetical protein